MDRNKEEMLVAMFLLRVENFNEYYRNIQEETLLKELGWDSKVFSDTKNSLYSEKLMENNCDNIVLTNEGITKARRILRDRLFPEKTYLRKTVP